MARPPAISVLIPVYNGGPYLETCLSSVSAQTRDDWEAVIADDGSTDGSAERLAALRDPRFRVLPREGRRRLFGNLNRLVRESRAPLAQVLCQDDAMEPDCLGEVVRFFGANPEVHLLFSKFHIIDESGRQIDSCALGDLPEIMSPMLSLQHFFYHGCFPGNLSTTAFRRAAFEAAGPFDESFGVSADYEQWARMAARGDMGVIHRHLLRVRRHAGQLSRASASGPEFVEQNRRVRARLLPLLPPAIRAAARAFERRRHFVLDFHYAVRALVTGRARHFTRVVCALGPFDFSRAGLWWLATMNNHLHRPAPRFQLPKEC